MKEKLKLKFAIPVCLFMVFLSLFPQINLKMHRGENYNGSIAYYDFDEPAYAAYVKSLVNGKSRKNNPYIAKENLSDESLFSIQYIPPYVIATFAKLFGFSVETSFILVSIFCAFFTALAVFWLIGGLTEDSLLALIGSLTVLVFGTLLAGQGALKEILGMGNATVFFPFLRRYIPAFAMPIMFFLFGLIWKGLKTESRQKKIIFCGISILSFNILLYSYFYIWSAVLAWLILVLLLYLVFCYKHLSKDNLTFLITVNILCLVSLIPYFLLVLKMANHNGLFVLESTRLPVFINPTLLVSYGLIFVVGVLSFRENIFENKLSFIFLLSYICLPFILFNQQIITGYSMQAFHYSRYVGNYTILIGSVIIFYSLCKKHLDNSKIRRFAFLMIPLICIWGIVEVSYVTSNRIQFNSNWDEARPINQYLAKIPEEKPIDEQTTINFDLHQAEIQPMFAPQPILWSFHMNVFNGITPKDYRYRYYRYLYFNDMSPKRFAKSLRNCPNDIICTHIFNSRFIRTHSIGDLSPKPQEIKKIIDEYQSFYEKFDKKEASKPILAFAIARKNAQNDFFKIGFMV